MIFKEDKEKDSIFLLAWTEFKVRTFTIMAVFKRLELYRLHKAVNFSFAETTKRQRRQYGPLRRPKCAGGMTQDEALIYCYKPDLKCKVSGRVCYKYLYCKVGGKDEIKPIALSPPIMASMSSTGSDNCLEFHDWVNVVCCEYVCR